MADLKALSRGFFFSIYMSNRPDYWPISELPCVHVLRVQALGGRVHAILTVKLQQHYSNPCQLDVCHFGPFSQIQIGQGTPI